MSKIPYLKKTKKLLEKYDFQLPVLKYKTYSRRLKVIQKECYIRSIPNLTSHTGRKFHGDNFLNHPVAPVSIETVSKNLGHSNITTTQKSYADVALSRMGNEILKTGEW